MTKKGGMSPLPAPFGGAGGAAPQGAGLFGNMTPQRYETLMNLITAATVSAGQSNSPVAAFLAPIVGSIVSSGAQRGLDAYSAQSAEALLGRPLTPQEQQAAAIAGDDGAPDYLRSIAKSMLPTMAGGGAPRTGSARRKAPAAPSAPRPAKLTYIQRDADGIYRGYNAATGKREVVPNADVAAAAGPATTGQPVIPPPPPDPVLPRDPGSLPPGGEDLSGLSDEELLSRYR